MRALELALADAGALREQQRRIDELLELHALSGEHQPRESSATPTSTPQSKADHSENERKARP